MKRSLTLFVAALALVGAACGGDATPSGSGDATRTIEITMRDIAFEPTSLQVSAGDTVRFVFTNEGKVDHDAFIGDAAAQADHEKEMRASGDAHAGHGGDAEGSITVAAGDTAELTHTFEEPGEVQIGCHEPGHYDAGMKIDVTVA
ncbi:MAG: hypothetical protein QOG87_3035 [Actinomycetota bacterium]